MTVHTVRQGVTAMSLSGTAATSTIGSEPTKTRASGQFEESVAWTSDEETMGDNERCKTPVSRSVDVDERMDREEAAAWLVDRAERFHEFFDPRLRE